MATFLVTVEVEAEDSEEAMALVERALVRTGIEVVDVEEAP
jgi:hypothetical protein